MPTKLPEYWLEKVHGTAPAAQQFISTYPTPRALRREVQERELSDLQDLLSTDLKALPMICDDQTNTIGYFLTHGGLTASQVHSVIADHARR